MRTPTPAPPRLAARILSALLGRDARTSAADTADLYRRRVVRDGVGAARLWYWRQVFGCARRWRSLRTAQAQETAFRLHGESTGRTGDSFAVGAWGRDLKLAARSLRRTPAFAVLIIVTLALGIGANTAIFSVLYGSLLRALPYAEADRLVWISDGHENFGGSGSNISVPNFIDLSAAARTLDLAAVYKVRNGNLSTAEQPERVRVLYASSEFLGVLGVTPLLGRDLAPEDDFAGAERVVLLTDMLWRTRFGADPSIVGTTTTVDARPVLIAGVLPAGFSFPGEPALLTALQHEGAEAAGLLRGNRGHFAIGRIAAGSNLGAVQAELLGISASLAAQYPEANEGFRTYVEPLRVHVVARGERTLLLLAGAVALVLLIACVNVANLMMTRAEARRREFAVRYSLGATRGAMLSLFLGEGLLLSLVGGAVGLLIAYLGVDLLLSLYAGTLPRADQIEINGTALLFTLCLSTSVGTLVGIVPWLQSRPENGHQVLKSGDRGSSRGRGRLGSVLVVAEVALAVLIVVAAGLLSNSLWRLQSVDLGLVAEEQVLTFRFELPTAKYRAATIATMHDELLGRLREQPDVIAAALVNRLPLLGGDNTSVTAFGDPERAADFVSARMVSSQYFAAVGAELVAGRLLDEFDQRGAMAAIVINERLARELFAGDTAVGARIEDPTAMPGTRGYGEQGLEVVGVIRDIVGGRTDRAAPAAFYYPISRALQLLGYYPELGANEQIGMSVLVRTAGNPRAMLPAAREILHDLDPEVPVFAAQTLAEVARDRLGTQRFTMSLFAVFATLALVLGVVGIYGVMSFGVTQRSRELGVRMALGASPRAVMSMVLGEGARLAAPGVVLGLVLAAATARLLSSQLYEVSPLDPATYAAVAAVLATACVAAAYLPARRATRVDPLSSIRAD